jgi:hypothetical protein
MKALGIGLGVIGVLLLIALYVFLIAVCILVIVNIYTVLNTLGWEHPFLGCIIPIYSQYALSSVAVHKKEEITFSGTNIKISAKVYKWWILIAMGCCFVPMIGSLASLIVQVACWMQTLILLQCRLTGCSEDDISFGLKLSYGLIPWFGLIFKFKKYVAEYLERKERYMAAKRRRVAVED